MSLTLPILGVVGSLLDKIIPDADKRAEAKIQLAQLEQNGDFRQIESQMQTILMEAKSNDKWTSRARPGFLYVMYIFILSAIPMGVFYAYDPTNAAEVANGVKAWLGAIPQELYALFGAGYLGYVKKRSDDKMIMVGKDPKKLLGIF